MSKQVLVKFDYSRGSDNGKRIVLMDESKLRDSLMSGLDAHRNGEFRQFHRNCCSNIEVHDCEVIQAASQADAHKTAMLHGNKTDTYVIDENYVYNVKLRDDSISTDVLKIGEMGELTYNRDEKHIILRTFNQLVSLTNPSRTWNANAGLRVKRVPLGFTITLKSNPV